MDTGGRGGGLAASGARGAETACARRSASQVDLGAAAAAPGVGEDWFVTDELGAPCGAPNAERGAPVLVIRHVDGILPGAVAAAGVVEPRVRSFRVPEGQNAAALAEPPRVPRRPPVQVSADNARQILAAVEGTRLEALVTLTLLTGLRQGEVLGLRWSDLDLEGCTLRVGMALQRLRRGPGNPCPLVLVEPKTRRSRRTVDFPPAVAATLRRHRAAQVEERLRAGGLWEEPITGLVFTTALGRPLDGPTVTKAFQEILARAGLPRLTYHELRHACATLLLASGTDIAVVRDILGHSTIALTADTYAAVLPSLQRAAADRLAAFIGVGSTAPP